MRRRIAVIVLTACMIVGLAMSVVVVAPAWGAILADHVCEQTLACNFAGLNECTMHSTDCYERNCGFSCPAVITLKCKPREDVTCHEWTSWVCGVYVTIKSCQPPAGGGNCICDLPYAGSAYCPRVYKCYRVP